MAPKLFARWRSGRGKLDSEDLGERRLDSHQIKMNPITPSKQLEPLPPIPHFLEHTDKIDLIKKEGRVEELNSSSSQNSFAVHAVGGKKRRFIDRTIGAMRRAFHRITHSSNQGQAVPKHNFCREEALLQSLPAQKTLPNIFNASLNDQMDGRVHQIEYLAFCRSQLDNEFERLVNGEDRLFERILLQMEQYDQLVKESAFAQNPLVLMPVTPLAMNYKESIANDRNVSCTNNNTYKKCNNTSTFAINQESHLNENDIKSIVESSGNESNQVSTLDNQLSLCQNGLCKSDETVAIRLAKEINHNSSDPFNNCNIPSPVSLDSEIQELEGPLIMQSLINEDCPQFEQFINANEMNTWTVSKDLAVSISNVIPLLSQSSRELDLIIVDELIQQRVEKDNAKADPSDPLNFNNSSISDQTKVLSESFAQPIDVSLSSKHHSTVSHLENSMADTINTDFQSERKDEPSLMVQKPAAATTPAPYTILPSDIPRTAWLIDEPRRYSVALSNVTFDNYLEDSDYRWSSSITSLGSDSLGKETQKLFASSIESNLSTENLCTSKLRISPSFLKEVSAAKAARNFDQGDAVAASPLAPIYSNLGEGSRLNSFDSSADEGDEKDCSFSWNPSFQSEIPSGSSSNGCGGRQSTDGIDSKRWRQQQVSKRRHRRESSRVSQLIAIFEDGLFLDHHNSVEPSSTANSE